MEDALILMIGLSILLLIVLLVLLLFIPSKKPYDDELNVHADLKKIKKQISPDEDSVDIVEE